MRNQVPGLEAGPEGPARRAAASSTDAAAKGRLAPGPVIRMVGEDRLRPVKLLGQGLFTLPHGIVDECEVDEAEEERIEFLEA